VLTLTLVSLTVIASVSGYLYLKARYYTPYLDETRQVLHQWSGAHASLSPEARGVVLRLSGNQVKHWLARSVHWELELHHKWRMLEWQAANALFAFNIESDVPQEDLLGAYCATLPYQDGTGIAGSARLNLDKELASLTADDMLHLLAIAAFPGGGRRGTNDVFVAGDLTSQRQAQYERLLERYRASEQQHR
jgi:hypothetical protein